MGKRGHRLWENVLVGSVSQAVLEKSLIPVVVVEKKALVNQAMKSQKRKR